MIFAQYKHAITFAVVILGLAVAVAEPGKDAGDDAAPVGQPDPALAAPAPVPAGRPQPPAAEIDPSWYGDAPVDPASAAPEAPAGAAPAADDAADDGSGGYNLNPASAGASQSAARSAAAPAVRAPAYVPPPPPPQVPPSR